MKNLGYLEFYMGMRITKTADYIAVDQERHTLDVLKKYENLLQGLENKNFSTPMERDLKLRKVEVDSMTDTLIKILWAHFFIFPSIPGRTSHIQWEY